MDYHFSFVASNNNLKGSTFESIKKVAAISLPDDFNSREERYPANISFPNKNFAFISNGYGQLSLYSTGDRSKSAVWEECLDVSKLLNTNDNKSAAFIIAESVSLKEDCVDVLLRKVIPKERHSSKSHFWNKLLWISLTYGHIEMITFDSSINNLIVDSCGDVNFVYDSAQKISRNHRTSLVEDESGQIVEESMEEDKKLYCWMQSDEDVTVVFNIGEVIHKKDVSLTMSSSKIKITIKGELLLEGELGGVIHVDGSTYTIDKNM
ncbi:unnamed protein product [Anisakis simplex]|uniref:NudC domain-containing protein 1 n=1 Tax=Anisakis simplex TaxID=6269 RepID=A0A0M3J338_ANISI|nr:unnamed protein product [Anisakis simplex]